MKLKNVRFTYLFSGFGATSLMLCFGMLLGGVVTATPVFAQDDPIMEEIIVTARKRDETIMDVPVTIVAITAEQLAKFSKTDIRDLEANAPGVIIHAGASGAGGVISIRGMGTSPTQFGFEQAVSISVDNIQVGRARILTAGMLDVRQVEVMKGPQALFFGKNSPAGVLSVLTNDPGDTVEGYIKGAYEFVGEEAKIEGAVSIPVSDTFKTRFALQYRNMDGWVENQADRQLTREESNVPTICAIAGGVLCPIQPADGVVVADLEGLPTLGHESNGQEELIGRGTFLWEPTDAFTANLKITLSSYEDDGPTTGAQVPVCSGAPGPITRGIVDPFTDCTLDEKVSTTGLPEGLWENWPGARRLAFSELDNTLVSLNMNYQMGDWFLTSVTGYYDSQFSSYDNYDYTSAHQLSTTQDEDFELWTQELRLTSDLDGPLNYMIGAYFSESDLLTQANTKIFAFGVDPATGKYHNWEKPAGTDASTWSLFAQVIWDITDQWELAAGLRYTDEEKDSFIQHDYIHPLGVVFGMAPVGHVFTNNFSDDNWSPEATLSWRPTESLTLYGGYKTGYKSGGAALSSNLLSYNYARINEPGYDQEYIDSLGFGFDAEEIEGFEFGLRSTLMEGRMALNVSAYTYDYTDLQVSAFDAETTAFTINNAADASVDGIEFDVSWMATDELRLYTAINYNKSEYEEYITACSAAQTDLGPGNNYPGCFTDPDTGAQIQNLAGHPLVHAPEWSANFGFDFFTPVSGAMEFSLAANARYSDDYSGADNGDPRGIQESFWIFDASARLSWPDSGYYLSLIGRNLGDEYYASRYSDKPGQSIGQIAVDSVRRGRQIVLELGYDF
jgi:outer membrane receptor protein involved in Fe transport